MRPKTTIHALDVHACVIPILNSSQKAFLARGTNPKVGGKPTAYLFSVAPLDDLFMPFLVQD